MWRRVRRWWSEIDWNWRNFNAGEWLTLALVPICAVFAIAALLDRYWLMAAVFALDVPAFFAFFVSANRERQNPTMPRPEPERLDPADRPLRLAFGLGFLALLTVLGLIVWVSTR